MNNPQRVHKFLKQNINIAICDDCIGKHAGVNRHEANTIAHTLVLFPNEFTRKSGVCSQGCSNRDKELTTAV
jgi:hypothetical protein